MRANLHDTSTGISSSDTCARPFSQKHTPFGWLRARSRSCRNQEQIPAVQFSQAYSSSSALLVGEMAQPHTGDCNPHARLRRRALQPRIAVFYPALQTQRRYWVQSIAAARLGSNRCGPVARHTPLFHCHSSYPVVKAIEST